MLAPCVGSENRLRTFAVGVMMKEMFKVAFSVILFSVRSFLFKVVVINSITEAFLINLCQSFIYKYDVIFCELWIDIFRSELTPVVS